MEQSEQPVEQRAGRGRRPCAEMGADELVRLLATLGGAGIPAWLDGGWGVDAVLGEQRRPHDDLDLVVALSDVRKLQDVLARKGYTLQGGGAPLSFELVDPQGRQVDVHPVTFDESGDGIVVGVDRHHIRSMRFRGGSGGFRLCEAVRERVGADVVLTFCDP